MRSPSRRDVLAASGGLLVGLAGGYVARPLLETESPPDPAPLAWADTEWPYPDYDPQRTRNPPPESAPDGDLSVDWRRDFDDAFRHVPLVTANGQLYAASSDRHEGVRLRVFETESGHSTWERRRDDATFVSPGLLVPGDGVYYRFEWFEDAPLGCLSPRNGEPVWGIDDPPDGGWTIGDGRLYHGASGDGSVRAYDARTGAGLWTTDRSDERLDVWAFHPDVGVLATSREVVYALDPADGSTRWEVALESHVRSGPIATEDAVFFVTGVPNVRLVAVGADSGDELWQYPLSRAVVETEEGRAVRWYDLGATTGDVVVAREEHADPTPGALHAVDADSGDRLWRVEPPDGARAFSKPIVVDGSVYVCTSDERTELQRRDLADGALTGSWQIPGYTESPIVADGRVLVQTPETLVSFT